MLEIKVKSKKDKETKKNYLSFDFPEGEIRYNSQTGIICHILTPLRNIEKVEQYINSI